MSDASVSDYAQSVEYVKMERYKSRKFIAALLALASVHWALVEKLIEAGDYKTVLLGTIGAYIIGNVAQKAVKT